MPASQVLAVDKHLRAARATDRGLARPSRATARDALAVARRLRRLWAPVDRPADGGEHRLLLFARHVSELRNVLSVGIRVWLATKFAAAKNSDVKLGSEGPHAVHNRVLAGAPQQLDRPVLA